MYCVQLSRMISKNNDVKKIFKKFTFGILLGWYNIYQALKDVDGKKLFSLELRNQQLIPWRERKY